MRKRRIYLSQLTPNTAWAARRFNLSLVDRIAQVGVDKFGFDRDKFAAAIQNLVALHRIPEGVKVESMTTPVIELLALVNTQAVVQIAPDTVDVTGVDIGDQSISFLASKAGSAFSGSLVVAYHNLTGEPLPVISFGTQAERNDAFDLFIRNESLENLLAAFKAVNQPALVEISHE